MYRKYNLRPRKLKLKEGVCNPNLKHCPICLLEIKTKRNSVHLACNHEFHASCFTEWVTKSSQTTCPTCRRAACEPPPPEIVALPDNYEYTGGAYGTRNRALLTNGSILHISNSETVKGLISQTWGEKYQFLMYNPSNSTCSTNVKVLWGEILDIHANFVELAYEIPSEMPYESGEDGEIEIFLSMAEKITMMALANMGFRNSVERRRKCNMSIFESSSEEPESLLLRVVFGPHTANCAPISMGERLNILTTAMSRAIAIHDAANIKDRIRAFPYSFMCSGAILQVLQFI